MADAIGNVRATFTASAGGMVGAIDQIVGKLGGFAAAQRRAAADTTRYESVAKELASEFMRGGGSADDYADKLGNVQGRFRGLSEADRTRIALEALSQSFQGSGRGSEEFAAAQERVIAVVRAGTGPMERLSIDLRANRQAFLDGSISVEQYRQTIATLPGQINGTETAAAKMERVFKQSQETVRGLRSPTAEYEEQLARLNEQLEAGFIDDEQYAQATAEVTAKLQSMSPEATAAAAAAEQLAAAMERGKAVTEQFLSPQEQFDNNMAEMNSLLAQGAISQETYERAVAAAKDKLSEEEQALRDATPEAKALAEAMEEGKRVTQSVLSPTEKYEQELSKLDGLLAKGAISQETHARATQKAKEELDKANPAAKSVGDAFGGLPGPLGAAARAFDTMKKSMGDTIAGFKSGGLGGGISSFVGQVRGAIANAGSSGGASLVGIAPQIGLIATAAAGGVAAVKALTGALMSAGAEVERTAQLASRLGVSFQEYEVLAVAANNAGVETEALAAAQTKGLKAISAAREGAKEQSEAFAALGISQQQLNSNSPNETLELAAKKLSAIEDPATRAALAMQIFGKSGNDILPALAAIDATREGMARLGGTMSQVDVERFSAMDDAFDNLGVAGDRLGKTLLAPFTELFARVSNGLAAVAGGLSKAFAPIGNLLAEVGGAIGFIVERLGESLGVALRVVGALLQMSSITAIAASIGAQVELISSAFEGIDSFIEPIVAGLEQVAAFVSDNITRAITAIYAIIGNVVSSVVEWVSQSSLLTPLVEGLSAAASFVADAFKAIGGWVSYVVQQLEAWAGIEPKPMKSAEDKEAIEAQMAAQKQAAKEEEDRAKKAQDRAKAIKEDILSPYEKMQEKVAELNDLEQRGLLTAQERAAAEGKIRDEFAKQDPLAQQAKQYAEEQAKAAKKAAEEQAKAVENIDNTVKQSMKAGAELGAAADPIKSAFKNAADDIKANLESGLLTPDEAADAMKEAVDAMNEELKRLGEDQDFAKKIREGFKSEADKAKDELSAIDKNQTLTAEEKERAKKQVSDKFKEGLPGASEKDAANKFREDQAKLIEAFNKGLLNKDEFKERQDNIRKELNDSVSDIKDKQERNKGADRRAVSAVDVNSSEGASTFFRLLRGQDDPTKKQIEEMRKQTRLLERVAEADAEVVQI